jgi:drug/metabolite transporter (DMT)-like permease
MSLLFLSLGLLLSGTLSTMSAKAADQERGFDHPYVQVLFMFIGEFVCLFIAPVLESGRLRRQQQTYIGSNSKRVNGTVDIERQSEEEGTDSEDEQIQHSLLQQEHGNAEILTSSSAAGPSTLSEFPILTPSPPPLPPNDGMISAASSAPTLKPVVTNNTRLPNWVFAVPAALDVLGSTLIFLGLQKTTPSQFQLMRSSLVPFTSLVSLLVFRKYPKPYQIIGILFIVSGIICVSFGAEENPEDDILDTHEDEFVGNMFVLLAQLVLSFQLVWEEKMYPNVNPLVAVGMEGIWGIGFTCLLIFVLQFIDDSSRPGGKVESIHAAFTEMSKDGLLCLFLFLNMMAVSLLNSFGVTLMVTASAAHRTVIDTLRIIFIWIASILVGWEASISILQLGAFALLVCGISLYNKLIKLPCFEYEIDSMEPSTVTPVRVSGSEEERRAADVRQPLLVTNTSIN